MVFNYDVTYGENRVGTVQLEREGLYLRLRCSCRVQDNEIHRLYADGERIGLLIPDRGELVLETRVAAKRLKPGCRFFLDECGREFVPIRTGEAFAHLDKVRGARLAFQDGEPGIFLNEASGNGS